MFLLNPYSCKGVDVKFVYRMLSMKLSNISCTWLDCLLAGFELPPLLLLLLEEEVVVGVLGYINVVCLVVLTLTVRLRLGPGQPPGTPGNPVMSTEIT